MKRFLLLASMGLVLGGCGDSSDPHVLATQNIDLGYAKQKTLKQSFQGNWEISYWPMSWLNISTSQGTGDVKLTVTAKRSEAADLDVSGQQSQLKDVIEIKWNFTDPETGEKRAGITSWPITADLIKMSGQVVRMGTTGADVVTTKTPMNTLSAAANKNAGADGVIVVYRSAQVRNMALKGVQKLQIQRQGVDKSANKIRAQALQAAQTLERLSIQPSQQVALSDRAVWLKVKDKDVKGTMAALQRQPEVQSVVRNVRVRALGQAKGVAAQHVRKVGRKELMQPPVVPTDQYAYLQWAYKLMGYQAVWRDMENTPYRNPVNVAVIDTGVRYDHPDLGGRLIAPGQGALDLVAPSKDGDDKQIGDGDGVDTDPTDPTFEGRTSGSSHGTHVTGIIAARWGEHKPACPTCTKTGVVGATFNAPIKVLPIRVLDGSGYGSLAAVVQAIDYAAGKTLQIDGKTYRNPVPVKVINLSLGGQMKAKEVELICSAVSDARQKGILVIAAAGNDNVNDQMYPAACSGAVAVASTTLSGASAPRRAVYSNFYKEVQLSAPGGTGGLLDPATHNGQKLNGKKVYDDIFSTDWDYQENMPSYQFHAGTSQAAPQVAALAALMLSKGVTRNAEDTLKRLTDTATDLGAPGLDPYFGHGMINAAAALKSPWVGKDFGLRIQSFNGVSFQPKLDAVGRFSAFVPDQSYQVIAGEDLNDNGIFGEKNEPSVTKKAELSLDKTTFDVGELKLK